MEAAVGVTEIDGTWFTVIITVFLLEHDVVAVPVTVYVVVEVGLAETVAPVVPLRPVAGSQV
jgi:hypothetical protein